MQDSTEMWRANEGSKQYLKTVSLRQEDNNAVNIKTNDIFELTA